MPEHQNQIQLQAGFPDSCRPAKLLHGHIQPGSQQLLRVAQCPFAQFNAGMGVYRQGLGPRIASFAGQLGSNTIGIPSLLKRPGRTKRARTNNLSHQLRLGRHTTHRQRLVSHGQRGLHKALTAQYKRLQSVDAALMLVPVPVIEAFKKLLCLLELTTNGMYPAVNNTQPGASLQQFCRQVFSQAQQRGSILAQ